MNQNKFLDKILKFNNLKPFLIQGNMKLKNFKMKALIQNL